MPDLTVRFPILIAYQWFPDKAGQTQPMLWRRAELVPTGDGLTYTAQTVAASGDVKVLSMVPYLNGGKFEYRDVGAQGPYEVCYIANGSSDLVFEPRADGEDVVVPFRRRR